MTKMTEENNIPKGFFTKEQEEYLGCIDKNGQRENNKGLLQAG